MAATKQAPDSPEERAAALAAYDRFLEEANAEPIKFLKHDNRAHSDDGLYRLVDKHGMAWYGWYWLLAELLAARKGHAYDVSDAAGWGLLTRDMNCLSDLTEDECREFIAELYAFNLISREQLDEKSQVVITRIRKDANTYAEDVAGKRLGAWKTNRRRMLGQ